jgi:hypothetical protein
MSLSFGCILMCPLYRKKVGSLEIPKIVTLGTLEGHNFLCRHLIKARFLAKL